jgi:hypothetical protein
VTTEKVRLANRFECVCGYKNDFFTNHCINIGKQFMKRFYDP